VLLGAAALATLFILTLSLRALGTRDAVELRYWDLQVRRALASVERVWYMVRSDAGRGQWTRGGGRQYVVEFYCWAAGAIALLAGAVSAGVLAQQWRRPKGRPV
jgi:hypothetical protein